MANNHKFNNGHRYNNTKRNEVFKKNVKDLTNAQKELLSELRSDSGNYTIRKEDNFFALYFRDNLVRVLNFTTVERLIKINALFNIRNSNVYKLDNIAKRSA